MKWTPQELKWAKQWTLDMGQRNLVRQILFFNRHARHKSVFKERLRQMLSFNRHYSSQVRFFLLALADIDFTPELVGGGCLKMFAVVFNRWCIPYVGIWRIVLVACRSLRTFTGHRSLFKNGTGSRIVFTARLVRRSSLFKRLACRHCLSLSPPVSTLNDPLPVCKLLSILCCGK